MPLTRDNEQNRKRMAWALGLAVTYMVAEIVGGLLSNSLALLADAGHMASDAAALGLSLWAMRIAEKPATSDRTYGYHRAEILAALANGATLVAISIYIFWEAYQRLIDPPEVIGGTMMAVAAGGLVVNGIAMWLLHGGRDESLNVRGAWLHVLGDTLGSIGVILGGVLVWTLGWRWADPVAGALIGVLILYSSWELLQDSVRVLMAASPEDVDVDRVRATFCEIDGVRGVHDLHVWTLTSGIRVLTAHVDTTGDAERDAVLDRLDALASEEFDIDHSTFQLESDRRREECGDRRTK